VRPSIAISVVVISLRGEGLGVTGAGALGCAPPPPPTYPKVETLAASAPSARATCGAADSTAGEDISIFLAQEATASSDDKTTPIATQPALWVALDSWRQA
jgi:hypothetical protein